MTQSQTAPNRGIPVVKVRCFVLCLNIHGQVDSEYAAGHCYGKEELSETRYL